MIRLAICSSSRLGLVIRNCQSRWSFSDSLRVMKASYFGALAVLGFVDTRDGVLIVFQEAAPVDVVVDLLLDGDLLGGGHLGRRRLRHFRFGQLLVAGALGDLLQGGVLLELLADGVHELQPGELQELDRHLQLRAS